MNKVNKFTIGEATINVAENTICHKHQEPIHLQPKVMEVLYYLATNHKKVISREQLIQDIWGGNFYVGEKALNNAIWHLRKNLQYIAPQQDTIVTIKKHGYKLVLEPQGLTIKPSNTLDHTSKHPNPPAFLKNKTYPLSITMIVFCVITFIWFYTSFSSQTVSLDSYITTEPGEEAYPSVSPDGNWLVYSKKAKSGLHVLYLIQTDANDLPQQLTYEQDNVRFSRWSNDGKRIYFIKNTLSYCKVTEMDIDTLQQKTITSCSGEGGFNYIDISSDDKILAFRGSEGPDKKRGIYFLDLTKPEQKAKLLDCFAHCEQEQRFVRFSNDPNVLAITKRKDRYNENIFIVDLKNKIEREITTGFKDIQGLDWHQDNKHIIFSGSKYGIQKSFLANTETQELIELPLNNINYPDFSKNSELYYQKRNIKAYISSLHLDSKEIYNPIEVIESNFDYVNSILHPTNDRMAYISNESGKYGIWESDISGSNSKQLLSMNTTIQQMNWSQTGRYISFIAQTDTYGELKIHIYDTTTNMVTQLKSPFAIHSFPFWGPNDESLFSAVKDDDKVNLYQFSFKDKTWQPITTDGGQYGMMLDSERLVYLKNNNTFMLKNIATNTESTLISQESFYVPEYSWTYDDETLKFFNHNNNMFQLLEYNLVTSELKHLRNFYASQLYRNSGVFIYPKPKQIFYSSIRKQQSDIKKYTGTLDK